MIDTRWFVSYKTYSPSPEEDVIITDVTPARWLMYRNAFRDRKKCVILYAEEISPSLAAELIHTAEIKVDYFKEVK